MKKIIWVLPVLILGILLVTSRVFLSKPSPQPVPVQPDQVNIKNLPGIQTGTYPWGVQTDTLKARLSAIGLPALSTEGEVLHTHQHLDIFINGTHLAIPTDIGVNDNQRFISPVHTHDDTGIIHVESPVVENFTLGQFFDVWGVRLTADCLGAYCVSDTNKLKIYSNGQLFTGNPVDLPLTSHQEIVIVYGKENEQPSVPANYNFPSGY